MRSRLIMVFFALFLIGVLASYDMPKNWATGGSAVQSYEMGIDYGAGQNGKNAATIKSISKEIKEDGYGSLTQKFLVDKYKGKRLRLTGYVKAKNVANWAGLFMRLEGELETLPNGKQTRKLIALDNMSNRAIRGTVDYTKCEIVLDVPDTAVDIIYGGQILGTGQIWFDQLNFEVVGNDVPQTIGPLQAPTNLDFEK